MNRLAVFVAIIFIFLALFTLLFADGPRRWYASLFFAFVGSLTLLNGMRSGRPVGDETVDPERDRDAGDA